jgi:hypothetical protein
MRHYFRISLAITTAVLLLLIQTGCQERTKTPMAEFVPPADDLVPQITFEETTCDFGEVTGSKKYTGQFKFTNAGNGLLNISDVRKCCGVVVTLDKKELMPGESGTLKVEYNTGPYPGLIRRQLRVLSNDKTNPKVTLTIKAEVVIRVDYKPTKIELLLNRENAGCPKITIRSLDKQPFSITALQSTGEVITADVDPSVEAVEFVLEPKVDPEKREKRPGGFVSIDLTHPELERLNIPFATKQRFQLTPTGIFLLNPRPQEPSINKVSIVSNYDEDFEIESTSSEKGTAKVIRQRAIAGGYRLEVEITPPPPGETDLFTDVVNVLLKGGETLKIKCYVRYADRKD